MFDYMKGCTIRQAIKLLADKFICHYGDILTKEDMEWAERIEKQLRNPYYEHNLDYIMNVVKTCIGDGLRIKFVKNDDSGGVS